MAKIVVVSYRMSWDVDAGQGAIQLVFPNKQQQPLQPLSAESFSALAAILKESPVFWDTEKKALFTNYEDPG